MVLVTYPNQGGLYFPPRQVCYDGEKCVNLCLHLGPETDLLLPGI